LAREPSANGVLGDVGPFFNFRKRRGPASLALEPRLDSPQHSDNTTDLRIRIFGMNLLWFLHANVFDGKLAAPQDEEAAGCNESAASPGS